jgi:hypothetical protein
MVRVAIDNGWLEGDLAVPADARGLATFLIDLLTSAEEERDRYTAEHRFDIDMLAERTGAPVRP